MNTATLPAIAPLPRNSLLAALILPAMAAIAAGCIGYWRSEGEGCVTLALALTTGAAIYLVLRLRQYRQQYSAYTGQLEKNEEAFTTALDSAANGVALVSQEGKFLRANKAFSRITGYSPDELMRLDFQTITHPDDLDADLRYVEQVLSRKIETYSMEKRYIRKDGSLVWILLTVSAMWDAAGNFRYFISEIQDINERKLLQEKLRTAEAKLRGQ